MFALEVSSSALARTRRPCTCSGQEAGAVYACPVTSMTRSSNRRRTHLFARLDAICLPMSCLLLRQRAALTTDWMASRPPPSTSTDVVVLPLEIKRRLLNRRAIVLVFTLHASKGQCVERWIVFCHNTDEPVGSAHAGICYESAATETRFFSGVMPSVHWPA